MHLAALVRLSDLPGRRCLRSASTDGLVVPTFKLSIIGSRTFKVAAAHLEDVTTSPTLPIFRKRRIFFTHLILTLFLILTFSIYPHSGFEVALLLRPLNKILND